MAEPDKKTRRWRDPPEDTGQELLEDMTASDLIWTLNRLPFRRSTATRGRPSSPTCLIAIDRHARDYLVEAIAKRRGGK
jgi:hypothetical protein